MKKLLLIFIPVLLSGCGESENIKKVKALVYEQIDPSITIGNALDNRQICKKVEWSEFKDDRNRDIVEYSCLLKTEESDVYLSRQFDESLADITKRYLDITTSSNFNSSDYLNYKNDLNRYTSKLIPLKAEYAIFNKYQNVGALEYIDALYNIERLEKAQKILNKYYLNALIVDARTKRLHLVSKLDEIQQAYNDDVTIDEKYFDELKQKKCDKKIWSDRNKEVISINDITDFKRLKLDNIFINPIEEQIKLKFDSNKSMPTSSIEQELFDAWNHFQSTRAIFESDQLELIEMEKNYKEQIDLIYDHYWKIVPDPENGFHYNQYVYKPSSINEIKNRLLIKVKESKSKSFTETEKKALELIKEANLYASSLEKKRQSTSIAKINEAFRTLILTYEQVRINTKDKSIYPVINNVNNQAISFLMHESVGNYSEKSLNTLKERIYDFIELTEEDEKALLADHQKRMNDNFNILKEHLLIKRDAYNFNLFDSRLVSFKSSLKNEKLLSEIEAFVESVKRVDTDLNRANRTFFEKDSLYILQNDECIKIFKEIVEPYYLSDNDLSDEKPKNYLKSQIERYENLKDKTYLNIVKPYNEMITNTINDLKEFRKANIDQFEQKIQWSIIENKDPAIAACGFIINYAGSTDMIQSITPDDCFISSYSTHYDDVIYNKAIREVYINLWDSMYD